MDETDIIVKLVSLLEVVCFDKDCFGKDAYTVKFYFQEAVVTIRIIFNDYSGADLVISNMTTLPDTAKRKGYGKQAIAHLLLWAKRNNLLNIRAVQITKENEGFWQSTGFSKSEDKNVGNDYSYQIRK